MPTLPRPSEIIKCTDLVSCFQAIYNFFFALLIALAFLNFLYGAFQYLLSGSRIFSQEEGKKRMINSIIAVIVALSVPIILNMINPEIFKAKLLVPKVTVKIPVIISIEEVEVSEKSLGDQEIKSRIERSSSPSYVSMDSCQPYIKEGDKEVPPPEWDWRKVFSYPPLDAITTENNDYKQTEYINPQMKNIIQKLNENWLKNVCLLRTEYGDIYSCNYKIHVTDGFSKGDHASLGHTCYGTAIDIIIKDKRGKIVAPDNEIWDRAKKIALETGFNVLDERTKAGSGYWTGAHLHLEVEVRK